MKTTEKQAIKRNLYFKNDDLDFFLQYVMSFQSYKGSSLGECLYAAGKVNEADPDTWFHAWKEVAEMVEQIADQSKAKGHIISAREAYLRANAYFGASLVTLSPFDEQFTDIFNRYRACFRNALSLFEFPSEIIEIPFEGKSLNGYFLKGSNHNDRLKTLIVLGDRFAEECYFLAGGAGLNRGYNILLVDLPGQGITPAKGLYIRADGENPIKAVVDYLYTQPNVDTGKIAVYGLSLNGYTATRAVIYEKRISACIANNPLDDMTAILKAEAPAKPQEVDALRLRLFDYAAWQAGTKDMSKLFELFGSLKIANLQGITCPMLCIASEGGDVAERVRQTESVFRAVKSNKKEIHIFKADEGADAHLQVNNLERAHQVIFDWLDAVYD